MRQVGPVIAILLPVRRSLIRNSITSEAKKNLYKGSVVRVSASYRPGSKVVGCGGGVKIFFIYQFSSKG